MNRKMWIHGYKGWKRACDECGAKYYLLLHFRNEGPDSPSLQLCRSCIIKAFDLTKDLDADNLRMETEVNDEKALEMSLKNSGLAKLSPAERDALGIK